MENFENAIDRLADQLFKKGYASHNYSMNEDQAPGLLYQLLATHLKNALKQGKSPFPVIVHNVIHESKKGQQSCSFKIDRAGYGGLLVTEVEMMNQDGQKNIKCSKTVTVFTSSDIPRKTEVKRLLIPGPKRKKLF